MRVCRECGCTDDNACIVVGFTLAGERVEQPCRWVEPDLCSACVP